MSEAKPNDSTAAAPSKTPLGSAKRLASMALLTIAVISAAVWGVSRWQHARTHVSTENAQVDGHIVPVLAKVGGYVDKVWIEDNRHVHRGDTLVVLDDTELRASLAEAEADRAAAKAEVGGDDEPGLVEAEVSGSRARRVAAEARLVAAEAQRDRAVSDLARTRELTEKQITSQQQLDAAKAAADAANADVSALEQDIAAARAAETSAEASSRAAEARLARAAVDVQRALLDLSYARITAPTSGVISQSGVEVGQLVQAGQPLAAVVDDSGVWVTANLKETETDEVREGQDVTIEVDAYPGCEARGVVESLSPATGSKFALLPPDNATGNFTKVVQRVPVRIAIVEGCGEDRPLRPGMSVVVHITVS